MSEALLPGGCLPHGVFGLTARFSLGSRRNLVTRAARGSRRGGGGRKPYAGERQSMLGWLPPKYHRRGSPRAAPRLKAMVLNRARPHRYDLLPLAEVVRGRLANEMQSNTRRNAARKCSSSMNRSSIIPGTSRGRFLAGAL